MKTPKKAGNQPKLVQMEKGKNYAWCSCGLSENQPMCDGKHNGTEFKPLVTRAEETEGKYFCTCKQTSNPPYCDGSHAK